MSILVILSLVVSLFLIIITTIVIAKWRSNKAYLRYVLFLVSGTIWVIVGTLETTGLRENINANLFLSKLDFTFAALIAYFILLFSIHFPLENIKLNLKTELMLFAPILFTIFLSWFGKIFYYQDLLLVYSIPKYIIYYLIICLYLLIFTFYNLFYKLFKSEGIVRIQLQYITWSLFITILSGLILSIIYAFNRTNPTLFSISYIITSIYGIATSYAMIKFRFLDIKIIIRKGLIYSFSLIITLALYTYIALAFKDNIEKYWNVSTAWTAVI
ncbi:MAG: histidine kinase N-terminal 7TM domain-containing protein, partial [Patescibacteria group bacterium]